MHEHESSTTTHTSNLPASFDVTLLLSKVEQLEKNNNNNNLLQRVKLIELDSCYHRALSVEQEQQESHQHQQEQQEPQQLQQQQQQASDRTRLFLALSFGPRTVAAQLFALELGLDDAPHDDSDNLEDGEDEMEWIDISHERVLLSQKGNSKEEKNGTDDNGVGSSVVVLFPPSRADSLPADDDGHKSHDNKSNTAVGNMEDAFSDITSCALIPSPTIQTLSNSMGSRMMTRRTVAVMLGTAHDEVISLLLHVSVDSSSENVRFGLGYEDCKIIENETLSKGEQRGVVNNDYPSVNQILPRAKRLFVREHNGALCDSEYNEGNNGGDGSLDDCDNYLDEHVQVIHPSVTPSMYPPQNQSHLTNNNGDGQEAKYSGIKSISFRRDNDSNLKRSADFDTDSTNDGGGRQEEANMNQDSIWVTYGSGTIAKLPSWKPFLSFGPTGGNGSGVDSTDSSNGVDDGARDFLGNGSSVVPLNSPFRSPLDVPPRRSHHRTQPVLPGDENKEPLAPGVEANDYWHLLSSAVASSRDNSHGTASSGPPTRALVLAGPSAPATTPPIAFHSSRITCSDPTPLLPQGENDDDQSDYGSARGEEGDADHRHADSSSDDEYGPMTGTVVEGTAALVKGALGAALGAVRWGFGTGGGGGYDARGNYREGDDDTPLEEFMDVDETAVDGGDHDVGNSVERDDDPFGAKRGATVADLLPWPSSIAASFPFSDAPRRFETATVDPSGSLVATTDNLGRVILFDMETEQPIRMWKGMRNCSCYFAELPYYVEDGGTITRLYLVVHLRQRGAVEVYRLRQGPRVSAISVPSQKDCAVVECRGPSSEGGHVDSFLLERVDDNETNGNHYIFDKLVVDDPDAVMMTALPNQTPAAGSPPSRGEGNKMQLKLLLQLISPDTNIQCTSQTILTTFKSIRALADLGEGLDAISKCNLENEKNIECSALHSQAVSVCKSRLTLARDVEVNEGSGAVRKEAMSELEMRVAYHDRLGKAYAVLRRYEEARRGEEDGSSNDMGTAGSGRDLPSSPWAAEALRWLSLSSVNSGFLQSIPRLHNSQEGDKEPLQFSKFAMACQPSSGGESDDRVYLTKIKRSRLPILKRIFRPLLQDLFVFKVVNSSFVQLGINEDFDTLQKYFGEWASTLSSNDLAKSNMYATATWRPIIRWLHDLILTAYDASQRHQGLSQSQAKLEDDLLRKNAKLETLIKFCTEIEDLPKAFLLAAICTDAISSASLQLEQKTYGKITQVECIRPWDELLRKLRTCLLISLRLGGDVCPPGGGNDPMTVSNVERSDMFSVYSWIARDELYLSHDNRVIMALESACVSSADAFYPSTVDGDRDRQKTIIFQSCGSDIRDLRNPTGLTDESHSRSLLFYLKDHAHFPPRLAANRALILANLWSQTPDQLHLLYHSISALRTVVGSVERFSLAAVAEIYQSRIRPVCRAMLFGFGEHELSEEVVSPLFSDAVWLSEFISVAKLILSMMAECMSKVPPASEDQEQLEPSSDMWPPLRQCHVLDGLVRKLRGDVRPSSVALHHTIIFTFEMTHSIDSFQHIVPSFSSLFLTGTLFIELPPVPKGSARERDLLDKAIGEHAEKRNAPVIDSFAGIKDVELFGEAMGLESNYVKTKFLIKMIRRGKESSINDLLGASNALLDKELFTFKVTRIMCARLDATITSLKRTKNYRGILSLLDADANRWVREEAAAECASWKTNNFATVSLIATHSMVMRLKSISESLDDASMSEKVDVICLMSGTLLKAVQAQEEEDIQNV